MRLCQVLGFENTSQSLLSRNTQKLKMISPQRGLQRREGGKDIFEG